jgi:hypothetical protein
MWRPAHAIVALPNASFAKDLRAGCVSRGDLNIKARGRARSKAAGVIGLYTAC